MSVRTHAKEAVDKLWHLTVFCTLSSANRHSRQSNAWIRHRINHFCKGKKKVVIFRVFVLTMHSVFQGIKPLPVWPHGKLFLSGKWNCSQLDLTVNSFSGSETVPSSTSRYILSLRDLNCSQHDLTMHSFSQEWNCFQYDLTVHSFSEGFKLFPVRPHGPFFLWRI